MKRFSYPFLACLNGDPTAHLSSALDTTGLTWTTGSHPWFGQTAVSHDGVDAAQSGGNMTCDIHSWLKTSVTGPGTVSFRWKAQIDGAESFVSFYVVNGSGTWPQAIYLNDSTDWRWETSFFGPGTHDLFWVTYGNCANYDEQVTAWLDEVVVTGPGRESAPLFTTVPTSQTVPPSVNVTFQAIAGGCPIPALQWRFNGTAIPGATNFTLVLTNAQTAQAGLYSVVASNTLGAITNTVMLTVTAGAPVSAPLAQVTGTVELDGFVGVDDGLGNYSGRRIVTFKATDANGVVIKAWNLGLDFPSMADHCGMANFTLTGVPPETARLSAKTVSHLRKRLPVTFTAGQAEMHFIGSALLRAGDVDDSNKVDLNDYFQLAAAWSTGDVAADLNGDGWVEMADQFILSSRWYQEGDPE